MVKFDGHEIAICSFSTADCEKVSAAVFYKGATPKTHFRDKST